jgi:hypothetical protein
VTALQDLEAHLKKCSVNPAHQFVDSLAKCPWCDIEAATGVLLFQVVFVGPSQTGFTIAEFWGKVTSVPNPGSPPALPRVEGRSVSLSSEALELQQATWGARIASGLFALVGGSSRTHTLKKDIEKKAADARIRWQNLQSNWTTYTSAKDFDELFVHLQNLRSQHDGIPQKRLQALHHLEANRYKLQLDAYLDSRRISHARIKGIGDARKATLQSYGIETAADVTEHRVLSVPGFGPVAAKNLRQWRDQQERRFRFDPHKGVDQAAKSKVERDILTERIEVERKLNEALSKLTVSSNNILMRRRTLLAQAEQAAADAAQAEADLRVASPIEPIVPNKRWIIAIGAVAVGGLIIVSNQSNGPAPPSPQAMPKPQQVPLPAATPVQPSRPTLPPHVEIDPKGQRQPEDGYDWSDANRTVVRWMPGKASHKDPHVIASDTEGKWEPEDGYDWTSPDRLGDKTVRWTPGSRSNRYPNVVAAAMEGQWQPADGYMWVTNPHRPEDMRVMATAAWLDQIIKSPAPVPPASPVASPFDQGLTDRAELEQWFASLSGDFRRGADWWAGHRSIPNPAACSGPASGMNQELIAGCEAAKVRLVPKDIRRKADTEYRRGWNTYNGTATPVPQVQVPPVEQSPAINPSPTDADIANRLNEQELRRIRGH